MVPGYHDDDGEDKRRLAQMMHMGSWFTEEQCKNLVVFDKLCQYSGYILGNAYGDGACLFRSVAFHRFNDEHQHRVMRRAAVDYVLANWAEL